MLRKDYFVRQLEEFGKVLGVLLFLKKEKDWEKFEKESAMAAKKFTTFDMDYLENLDTTAFKNEVVVNEKMSLEQKKILANILYEKLDYYGAKEREQSYYDTVAKCLELYMFLEQNHTQNEFDLETHYPIEFLKKLVF